MCFGGNPNGVGGNYDVGAQTPFHGCLLKQAKKAKDHFVITLHQKGRIQLGLE